MTGIVTRTQSFAEMALHFQMQRQNIVLSNIANVDTPGYKAKQFSFEAQLQEAIGSNLNGVLRTTNARHYPKKYEHATIQGIVEEDNELRTIWGLDEVNLEKELKDLTQTNLTYNALATVVQKGYAGLQEVIREGQ